MRTDKLQDNDRTYRARRMVVLVFLAVFLSLSFAAAAAPSERWYLLSLAGQPVGSVQESFSEAGGALVTETRLQLVLNRLGKRVELASASTSRESGEGRLTSAGLDLKMSDQTTSVAAEMADGAVHIRSQAGRELRRLEEMRQSMLAPW